MCTIDYHAFYQFSAFCQGLELEIVTLLYCHIVCWLNGGLFLQSGKVRSTMR